MKDFLSTSSQTLVLSGVNTPSCTYYLVNKPDFLIGSAKECDACLFFSSEISHHHARISWQDETYTVCDLGSTNGTLLNGQLLCANCPCPLQAGDQLTFSTFSFTVEQIRR